MSDELKPYPEYKESGVPWLGRMPRHWHTLRAKYLYREVDERSTTGEETLCSVSHTTGVTPRKENVTMFEAESTVGHKICRPDDLVINTLWAWMAALGVAKQVGIVSPAYGVYRPRVGSELLPAFADRLLRIPQYKAEYMARSTGINASRLRLYPDQFLGIPILLPPAGEQRKILAFLDGVDRRINRFIRNRRRLIEVLNEQKQAIIHGAVTRGLDDTASLRSSGIDWLGEIPAHWQVLPLRRRCAVIDCKHVTVPFVEEGIPLASVREVQSFELVFSKAKRTTREWFEKLIQGNRQPSRGDIIYCRNVSVGAAAIVANDEPCAMGQDVCLIRSAENQRFVNYFFHSAAMERQLSLLLVGSTFDRINVADVKALTLPFPPRTEQDAIVEYLDGAVRIFDAPLAAAEREIVLIREYRTRLIADVVTGKVDVRHAAVDEPAGETLGDELEEEALTAEADTLEEETANADT